MIIFKKFLRISFQSKKIIQEPKNEKERLEVLQSMMAHAQFCMSGDHTLSATVQAINELSKVTNKFRAIYVDVIYGGVVGENTANCNQICAF
jgi:hypothetical protein